MIQLAEPPAPPSSAAGTTSPPPRILIVAGEASGDLHGAGLAEALRRLRPGLGLEGMGGQKMRAARTVCDHRPRGRGSWSSCSCAQARLHAPKRDSSTSCSVGVSEASCRRACGGMQR